MNDARTGRPPLNRDEADRALARLKDERERVAAALLELEGHHGFQLLKGAKVEGETRRVQAAVGARTATLWDLFDRYTRTLGAAEELRARHARPGQAQLAELTRLLTGPSVELAAQEVPLERRTLLASPSGERLTLAAVVARMTPLYEEVARTVARVDAVWSALLARLAEVEAQRRAAEELRASLGGPDPVLERLSAELTGAAETVRSDPMALARDDRADTSGLDALHAGLVEARRALAEADRLRAGFADRVRGIADVVARVRAAEAEARRVRADVLAKIAGTVPPPADLAAALADRLAALHRPGAAGGWHGLAGRVAGLEEAAHRALAEARSSAELSRGLLERREELRGRLDAYRVKAARLGHAEDAELGGLYEEARALLWTSPCDLRRATVALAGYQQAVNAKAKGAGR
ncbi:hypothetical protein [Spirillospora albida]|uniref:hypothetical protein n=1 Tax=Spirillospora albida TaxID=58123 RepID=UPI0004BEEF68|nr:hypothetical protein [Spirillospora albida]